MELHNGWFRAAAERADGIKCRSNIFDPNQFGVE
jgi:hypothetical protein